MDMGLCINVLLSSEFLQVGLDFQLHRDADGSDYVVVIGVEPSSQAAEAGIQHGDAITAVGSTPATTPGQVRSIAIHHVLDPQSSHWCICKVASSFFNATEAYQAPAISPIPRTLSYPTASFNSKTFSSATNTGNPAARPSPSNEHPTRSGFTLTCCRPVTFPSATCAHPTRDCSLRPSLPTGWLGSCLTVFGSGYQATHREYTEPACCAGGSRLTNTLNLSHNLVTLHGTT